MRYNVRKVLAGIVGGALLCTPFLALSAPLAPLEASHVVPMSLGQWQALRASDTLEDERGWDCRVQGNSTCGTVWWELVCPAGEQTPATQCALEPHSVTATPNE